MVCPKCGKESNSDFKFCTECGYNFADEVNDDSKNNDSDKNENIIKGKLDNVDNSVIESSNVDKSESKDEINVDKSSDEDEIVNKVDNSSQSGTISNSTGVVRKKYTGLIIGLVALLVIAVGVIVVLLVCDFGEKKNPNNLNNIFDNNVKENNGNNNTNTNTNESKEFVTKYDNYDVKVTMKAELAGVQMNSIFNGTVDEVNQTEHFNVSVTSLGMTVSMESYSDFKNGYTYMSDPIFGGWTRYSDTERIVDLNNIFNSLTNSNNTTKIDDNHYKIVINSNTIEGLMDASDFDYDVLDGDVKADVYLNNGYISKIVYDMGEIMKDAGSFTLEMEISNYNSAGSVVIPDEVKESATELE